MVYLDHVIQSISVERGGGGGGGGVKSRTSAFSGVKSRTLRQCDFLPPVNNSAICE